MTNLRDVLKACGKTTEVCRMPDGSRILVLPHGGRVLGLYSPANDENFLWTNPVLSSAESASAFYLADEWHNSGGDRTWLAPEVDFFLPDYPDLSHYRQPRSLDPGNYVLDTSDGSWRLVNRAVLSLSRSRQNVEVAIIKQVCGVRNPLRLDEFRELEYAGYALYTTLELLSASSDPAPYVGAWNLLQLPHGGDLFVPSYGKAEPAVVFGTIPADDLKTSDGMVQYRMSASGGQKISLKAMEMTGRAAYLYKTGDQHALVIRNFFVNPSAEYVDVPWISTEDTGYAVQACNVDNQFGSFAELEYHAPAIGGTTGLTRYDDISQVWAFRGSLATLTSVMERLVGVPPIRLS